MQTVYETNIKRGWLKPKIFRYADAASAEAPIDNFLNCMDEVVPLYQTAFFHDRTGYELSAPDASGRMEIAAGDLDGYYVSVKGTFRFVPQQVLLMLPKERPVRIQLDMNVMRSKITNRVEWAYPEEAVKRHIKGDVVIRLVLNTNGKIKEIKPVEGPPILSDAVLQAVKQWTFEPTTLDGEQVEVEITLKTVFGFSMTR